MSDPTVVAPRGMVASADHLASSAGAAVLRAGGSAVDAAISANAVLAVTGQHMCGLGGDLFALVHDGSGPPSALAAAGHAGSGADPAALRAQGRTRMPFERDIRSVTVPGCVDGWLALHERFGRVPLAELLAPARDYAEAGFPASAMLARAVAAGLRRPRRRGLPASRMACGRATGCVGRCSRARSMRSPARAATASTAATSVRGCARWATVSTRQRISRDRSRDGRRRCTCRLSATRSGPCRRPPRATWCSPVRGSPTTCRCRRTRRTGPGRTCSSEAARWAGHDRPDVLFDGADGAALLAEHRLDPMRAAIDPTRRTAPTATQAAGGTTYLCAVDADRMAVSLIQSNAAGWGAGIVVPGTGVFLQNRGIGFSLQAGHPAELAPGRRPPHTLAPALVTRADGTFAAVLGTQGGDIQPQILLQVLARLLRHGESPGAAVTAPRWIVGDGGFFTWTQDGSATTTLEDGSPQTWVDGLDRRGHRVEIAPPGFNVGHAQVIAALDDGMLAGVADPRTVTGSAVGW